MRFALARHRESTPACRHRFTIDCKRKRSERETVVHWWRGGRNKTGRGHHHHRMRLGPGVQRQLQALRPASPGSFLRPMLRLPVPVFPQQQVSVTMVQDVGSIPSFSVPPKLVSRAWLEHDGCLVCFGPKSRVGVTLRIFDDDTMEGSPPNVVHLAGAERVVLHRTLTSSSPSWHNHRG